jgi:HipA-like protein
LSISVEQLLRVLSALGVHVTLEPLPSIRASANITLPSATVSATGTVGQTPTKPDAAEDEAGDDAMPVALNVWMNGEHVGVWYASRNGISTFRYEPNWIRSRSARPLSLSLPITAGNGEHRGEVVANYFENLLPDSTEIRKRLSRRFKTKSTEAFDLLTAIGRDCVGAVQILPEGMLPEGWDRIESEPLTDDEVERIIKSATSDVPLGQRQGEEDDFRISIAGAQERQRCCVSEGSGGALVAQPPPLIF